MYMRRAISLNLPMVRVLTTSLQIRSRYSSMIKCSHRMSSRKRSTKTMRLPCSSKRKIQKANQRAKDVTKKSHSPTRSLSENVAQEYLQTNVVARQTSKTTRGANLHIELAQTLSKIEMVDLRAITPSQSKTLVWDQAALPKFNHSSNRSCSSDNNSEEYSERLQLVSVITLCQYIL